jgi:biopolymer transport protein ExbB
MRRDGPGPRATMTIVLQLLQQGGWFMAPILACSLLAFALFVERLWALRPARVAPRGLVPALEQALARHDVQAAMRVAKAHDSPLARVVAAGLPYAGRPRAFIRESMEEVGRRELFELRRFTGAIGNVATVSPLLGLLGTVVGMIEMFQGVVRSAAQNAGAANVAELASGIWQALITTAAGLLVAIPVFLMYRYLLGRIDRVAVTLEDVGARTIQAIAGDEERATVRSEVVDPAPGSGSAAPEGQGFSQTAAELAWMEAAQ